jgi:RNA-binding protein 5/10
LVVRGLDENADEEMLRYEFSKHAPIKVQNAVKFIFVLLENPPLFWHVHAFIFPNLQDLRLVRDKFTHVSRGFAFVHFHSVNSFVIGDWIC